MEMKMKNRPAPTSRLNRGNVLLGNAQMVDAQPLQPRFDAFVDMHRRYIEAQAEVDEAEGLERGELKHVEELDAAQDRAIAALAAALLLDGEGRRNPFGRFGDYRPSQILALTFAEKVKAVHALVAALRGGMGQSEATLAVADKAEEAALKVEEALPGWELRRAYLNVTRQARDSLVPQWETAYAALRHLTRSLVEAPTVYAALFPRRRRNGKKSEAAFQPNPDAELKAEETAATTATPQDASQAA